MQSEDQVSDGAVPPRVWEATRTTCLTYIVSAAGILEARVKPTKPRLKSDSYVFSHVKMFWLFLLPNLMYVHCKIFCKEGKQDRSLESTCDSRTW